MQTSHNFSNSWLTDDRYAKTIQELNDELGLQLEGARRQMVTRILGRFADELAAKWEHQQYERQEAQRAAADLGEGDLSHLSAEEAAAAVRALAGRKPKLVKK